MRVSHLRTKPAASFAAVAILLLAGSTACTEDADATGPLDAPHTQAAQVSQSAIPTDGILDMVAGRMAAWAAKDPTAYASAFAPDLRFINPAGVLISGREPFRATHVFLFNGPFAGSTLNLAVRDIQFLTGTVAIVHVDLSITGYAFLPPGVPAPTDGVARARVTWVVEKVRGEWQVVFAQHTNQA